ncbi:MAG: hypothetical protein ABIG64_09565 [Candidatus Omnitrophota bacterium]
MHNMVFKRLYFIFLFITFIALTNLFGNCYGLNQDCLAPKIVLNNLPILRLISADIKPSELFDNHGIKKPLPLSTDNTYLYHYLGGKEFQLVIRHGFYQQIKRPTFHDSLVISDFYYRNVMDSSDPKHIIVFKTPKKFIDYEIGRGTYLNEILEIDPETIPQEVLNSNRFWKEWKTFHTNARFGHLDPIFIDWKETLRANTILQIYLAKETKYPLKKKKIQKFIESTKQDLINLIIQANSISILENNPLNTSI